tara:strand:+ start:305 stop:520 length:216 start_codon:yes stop_codon:yes gene_type:complete
MAMEKREYTFRRKAMRTGVSAKLAGTVSAEPSKVVVREFGKVSMGRFYCFLWKTGCQFFAKARKPARAVPK